MSNPRRRPDMVRYGVFSLALHAGLILPWCLLQFQPKNMQSDKLVMELYGMIAERQAEARQAGASQSMAEQQTWHRRKKEGRTSQAESPVRQSVPDKRDATISQPVPEKRVAANSNASDQQKQQRLNVQERNTDELRRYLAKIKKKLQSNLVYPQEAKNKVYEGSPVVRFTIMESGAIMPGSLSVIRSSGYAILDANALKTVRDSEPFERPSRTIEVAIAVAFNLKS